jgi:uncharacterized repeat protein (TIGR03803 family)
MRKQPSRSSSMLILAFALALMPKAFAAPVEQVLHSFLGGTDGYNPDGGLVADAAGNLYGTNTWGGPNFATPYGTVFELTPPAAAGGDWTKTVLYSFQGGPNDGATPFGTLTFDKGGNLYGTTEAGGPSNTGTVFELSPPAAPGDDWTETVLYIFPADASQGYWPFGKLTFDGIGNLYGTTQFGGTGKSGIACSINGCGTVFQLKPPATAGGSWTAAVLYNFGSLDTDGIEPGRGLAFRLGSLYGTTMSGGTNNNGTVFRLVQNQGVWSEQILYNFTGAEGANPIGRLIYDSAGNLYGTARSGGNVNSATCSLGCGAVFEISPPTKSGDPWTETTLYKFTGGGDGGSPYTAVLRDTLGRLYGTSTAGGANNWNATGDNGTVFRLSPPVIPGDTFFTEQLPTTEASPPATCF